MLYSILLVVLVLDALVLVGVILLQAGKGGGLAANFGGASSSPDAFVGIRQAGTILTKATWWCGGVFLGLAFLLQIMSTKTGAPKSVLEDTFGSPAPASVPATVPGTAPSVPGLPLEAAPGAGGATQPAGTPATGAPSTTQPVTGGQVPVTPTPPPAKR